MFIPFSFKRPKGVTRLPSTLPAGASASTNSASASATPAPPQSGTNRKSPRSSPHMWGPTRLPFSSLAKKSSSNASSKGKPSLTLSSRATTSTNPPPNPTATATAPGKKVKPTALAVGVGVSYPDPNPNPDLKKLQCDRDMGERRWDGISKRDVMTRAGIEYLIKKLEPIERWQAAHAGALSGAEVEERREGEEKSKEGCSQQIHGQKTEIGRIIPNDMEGLQNAFAASHIGAAVPNYEIG